jgi:glyoxylate carboligase
MNNIFKRMTMIMAMVMLLVVSCRDSFLEVAPTGSLADSQLATKAGVDELLIGAYAALNGVFGAWVDSIPMIIISGQVKRETCLSHYNLNGILRQLGDQEVDIVAMTKGITKFSVLVDDPLKIKFYMKKLTLISCLISLTIGE